MSTGRHRVKEALGLAVRDPQLLWTKTWAFARRSSAPPASPGHIGTIRFEFDTDPQSAQMYRGAYEPGVALALRRHLRPGAVFADVGANIGYLSALGLANVGPRGRVHAFEPSPPALARLRRLEELNPNAPLSIHPFALGATIGEAVLSVAEENYMGWSSFIPDAVMQAKVHQSVTVPVTTFDRWSQDVALARLDVVKVDVEGFEYAVLLGMRASLQRWHPHVICEFTPGAAERVGGTLGELAEIFGSLGYRATDPERGGTPVDLASLDRQVTALLTPARRT